jgi:hypothetical protein
MQFRAFWSARAFLLAAGLGAFLCLGLGAPALADDGDGRIKVSKPGGKGTVKVTIKCKRANGTVEEIAVQVPIDPETEKTADEKRDKIDAAIDKMQPDSFLSLTSDDHTIHLVPHEGNKIISIETDGDDTNETIGHRVDSAEPVKGACRFDGVPDGGYATVAVDQFVAQTDTGGKTTDQIMQELAQQLSNQGVGAQFENAQIVITDNLANRELTTGDSDPGLSFRLHVGVVDAPIPTVSQWGLIVLTLLLLTAGTIIVGRPRRRPVAA